jgi:hypothetical protein
VNEQSTYARQLKMLHEICHGWYFAMTAAAFDKLLEYGWIKPSGQPGENCSPEWIAEYRAAPWYDGFDHSWFYVLTAKGHQVLSPRENRVEGLPVPFFPSSGCLTPDGQQVCILAAYLEQPEARA